jgi:hypothetical protein
MNNATKTTVSTFGALAALAGIEHGVGETLQGNVSPGGMVILSWPGSALFRILGGEPAMTILPNLLLSGIHTILLSLIFLVWATLFVQRKHGGLVLILLSIAMLLVGGGFGPPLLGIIVGTTATRIDAPLTWWRTRLSMGVRHVLGKLWSWLFVAALVAWLLLCPGSMLLDYVFTMGHAELLVPVLTLLSFGFLLLAIVAGLAHDSQRQIGSHRTPALVRRRPASQVGS